jgi:nickel superoxide dismutase
MKTPTVLALLALVLLLGGSRTAAAHCEVPCGIYDDPARFAAMLEDAKTIDKAMALIDDLSKPHDGMPDALRMNQLVRWVNTKEEHATHTMEVMGQYFMAQRIKPSAKNYVDLLKTAHAVITAAMKCKQTVDPANAAALRDAILTFQKAYAG